MRKNLRLAGLIVACRKAELLFVVNVKAKYGWNDATDRTLLVQADNAEQAQRHAAAHLLKTTGNAPMPVDALHYSAVAVGRITAEKPARNPQVVTYGALARMDYSRLEERVAALYPEGYNAGPRPISEHMINLRKADSEHEA